MNAARVARNPRILVIDDNHAIHDDFRKILSSELSKQNPLDETEAALFDVPTGAARHQAFEIDSAYQGREGLALVEQALRAGRPYALVFVDVRMPPGWDGIETTAAIWQACPDLQVVVCTAYSDYSWDDMAARLGSSDQLVILKKPFDAVEVLQLACALTEKWRLQQEVRLKVEHLESLVNERTKVLQKTNADLQAEIAERQRVSDRVREQAALLDLAHDAIFVRDMAGRVGFWNKGAESLYGWTAAEAVGRSVSELVSGVEIGAFEKAERVLLERGEWNGELHVRTRDSRAAVINSRWTLLRDENDRPRSVLVIDADITERKKLEAQFLRAQRMEGIGTLATGVAHDLNNILAPILMSAGALRWELSGKERESAISRIELSVQRGAEIIQQVLTFGRGVEGERVAVNPADLIEEIAKIVCQTFPKDITVEHQAVRGLWPVLGDKTQIHQVLLNLCINARDAMAGGGRLVLRARNCTVDDQYPVLHSPARPGPYVAFEVSDTGSGIPAGDLERIFDPFFTTKEFGKGTGLGLSTVLGIVKSHHGLISVDSELNKGTTFKILLPASAGAVALPQPQTGPALPHGAGQVILVVDDEENIVTANRRMLEKHGYHVLVAGNGQQALAHFGPGKTPVDLVITDIMMPVMDGLALIRGMRKIEPGLRIIASSGLGKDLGGAFKVSDLESLGVNRFLPKPYSGEQLLALLGEVLHAGVSCAAAAA